MHFVVKKLGEGHMAIDQDVLDITSAYKGLDQVNTDVVKCLLSLALKDFQS